MENRFSLINPAGKSPILRIDGTSDINHFFREEDHQPVREIVDAVRKANLDVYIAGGVLGGALFNNFDRTYRDVDLIAAGSPANTLKFIQAMNRAYSTAVEGYLTSLREKLSAGSEARNIKFGDVITYTAGDVDFNHTSQDIARYYVGGRILARFDLRPLDVHGERFGKQPSDIDLSILSVNENNKIVFPTTA